MTAKTQIGGTHYLGMAIQPRVFAMSNHWDADAFSVLKYLSRYMRKDGLKDLEKARHFATMRGEFGPPPNTFPPAIRMADYIEQNEFSSDSLLKYALRGLWDTVYTRDGSRLYTPHVLAKIDELTERELIERENIIL